MRWRLVERGDQRRDAAEIKIAVAPLDIAQRIETVILDGFDDLGLEAAHIGGGAEGAVVHVPAGAPRDLSHFDGAERAGRPAVKFAQAREPDVVHVHVETHADRVGRDQVVDLAGLEHVDLGVARARAHRPHDDRRAAALATDQFGDLVDLAGREADDGGAAGQARRLLRADVTQLGEARARHDVDVGQQPVQHRPDRVGTQQHGLVHAARMKEAIREEVAALGVCGHLHFVDGDERHRPLDRHRFDGADEIAGARRRNLLLAGDQRHLLGALDRHDPFVVFARQQAKRKADHARLMAEHALDREIGLAGVRGTENRGQAAGGAGGRHAATFACTCGGSKAGRQPE